MIRYYRYTAIVCTPDKRWFEYRGSFSRITNGANCPNVLPRAAKNDALIKWPNYSHIFILKTSLVRTER